MGRLGITQLDVEKAVMQLQGRGRNPTVDSIRELLGTGSKSTIAQHLRNWRSAHTDGNGALPQELLSLVTRLWERLSQQAENRITECETSNNTQLHELKQTLVQAQREYAELKIQFHHSEEILQSERQAKEDYAKQLEAEKNARGKLEMQCTVNFTQLSDHKAENARLHQLATHIQSNLEHYQNAMQQQRVEQIMLLEKNQVEFQQRASELQRELELRWQNSDELTRQLNHTNIEFKLLEEKNQVLEKRHEIITKEFQNVSQELVIFKERHNQCQQQLQLCVSELSSKTQEFIEAEKQRAIAADQRDQLRQRLSDAEDKIALLRQEKLFLTEEKSQLFGQFKQLKTA
jgi:chromosome segregation ATPase